MSLLTTSFSPHVDLALHGVDIVCNSSASHHVVGKSAHRINHLVLATTSKVNLFLLFFWISLTLSLLWLSAFHLKYRLVEFIYIQIIGVATETVFITMVCLPLLKTGSCMLRYLSLVWKKWFALTLSKSFRNCIYSVGLRSENHSFSGCSHCYTGSSGKL